jgi:hypothetical protein
MQEIDAAKILPRFRQIAPHTHESPKSSERNSEFLAPRFRKIGRGP